MHIAKRGVGRHFSLIVKQQLGWIASGNVQLADFLVALTDVIAWTHSGALRLSAVEGNIFCLFWSLEKTVSSGKRVIAVMLGLYS